MIKILFRLFIPLLLIMIVSCSGDSILKKMEHIKEIGDEAPEQAMAMLDSLELEVRDGNEYVRKKYDLLKIRLTDKAMIPHTSDVKIKELVGYFEKEGTLKEFCLHIDALTDDEREIILKGCLINYYRG